MNLNLEPLITKDVFLISEILTHAGLNYEDDSYLTYEDDNCEFGITLFPEILSYSVGGKGVPVEEKYEIWIACSIKTNDTVKLEMSGKIFKEFLKTLAIKPFKDEDAYMGIYATRKYCIKCYLNPDYPNGYWQNHAL